MASIELNKSAAKAGQFPPVCMRCGAPANDMFVNRLEWWERSIQMPIPLCQQHKFHVKQRSGCMAFGFFAALVPLVIFFWRYGSLGANRTNAFRVSMTGLEVGLLVLSACVFLAALLFVIGMHLNGIRVVKMNRGTVTLAGVASRFVEAMVAQNKAQLTQALEPDLAEAVTANPANLKTLGPTRDLTEWVSAQGPLAEEATWVLNEAQLVALSFAHDYVGTEHLLFALRTIVPTTSAFALKSLAIEPEQIEQVIKSAKNALPDRKELNPPATPQLRRAILGAFAEAKARQCPVLHASHLLVGLLTEQESTAAQILLQLGHDLDHVRQTIIEPEARIIAHRESIRET